MRGLLLIFGLAVGQLPAGVVLDRVAVVVGRHAIKASDIDRDIRVTAFLNRIPVTEGAGERRKSAERLIDQSVIRDEITNGDYDRATDREAADMLSQICRDRFAGSDLRLKQELAKYGLAEAELKEQLLWQLTVLRFIDERFRSAVMVSDEDVKAYYNGHLAELRQRYPKDSSLEAMQPDILLQLQNAGADKDFDSWLVEKRKAQRVDYHEEAFQ